MRLRAALSTLVLGLAACTSGAVHDSPTPVGTGGSSGSNGGTAGAPGTGGGATTAACVPGASFAHARLSLISDDQYRNIVRDAFGVTLPTTVTITTLPSTSGNYPYNESAQIATTTVQAYQRAADEVAKLLTAIPTCTSGLNQACMRQYLEQQLPLAWRRPPSESELAGLLQIFDSAAQDGATRQIQLTLDAALLHPAFLYRSEIGAAPAATGKVALSPFELASALSFATSNSVPDAELFASAKDGTLTQPAVLSAQVARLMTLEPVKANLLKKVSYYLSFEALHFVSKDAASYPDFAGLRGTLYDSSQALLNDVVWRGHFSDLFTTRTIYANSAMATAFGLVPVTGDALQPTRAPGDAYSAGLLTHPALLAATNRNAVGDDIVHRGLWVHDNLLCAPALPPPPASANAVAAMIMGSSREQAMIRDKGCGRACHGQFDAFGLVTLDYDNIGRYRTTDPTTTPPGGAIDTTATLQAGILVGQGDQPIELKNVNDLARALIATRQVSDCTAENLATYTLDHSPSVENPCELQAVKDRFQQNGSFAELFSAILTSPAFSTRDL